MIDAERELLRRFLEGDLAEAERPACDALLARDAAARRYVAEHQRLWSVLGEAFVEADGSAPPSAAWRETAVHEARRSERAARRLLVHPRWVAALAASLLLAVALVLWWSGERSPLRDIPAEDQSLVRYLHVLQGLDTLERLGDEFDLRGDFEVWRAFEGELEDEG